MGRAPPIRDRRIQLVGEAEKARILADEKTLLEELCAHRELLCLADTRH